MSTEDKFERPRNEILRSRSQKQHPIGELWHASHLHARFVEALDIAFGPANAFSQHCERFSLAKLSSLWLLCPRRPRGPTAVQACRARPNRRSFATGDWQEGVPAKRQRSRYLISFGSYDDCHHGIASPCLPGYHSVKGWASVADFILSRNE
jgi:hypothetical protein